MKLAVTVSILGCFLLTGCGNQSLALVEKNPDGIVFKHEKKVEADPYLGFHEVTNEEVEYYHLVADNVPKGKTYRLVVRTPSGNEINGGEYRIWNGALKSTNQALKLSEILVSANRYFPEETVECYLVSLDNTTCVKTTITPNPIDTIGREVEQTQQKTNRVLAHK